MDSPMEPVYERMEQQEPIAQVSEALRIIKDATETSSEFLMNEHQCTNLAHRVRNIGVALKESVGTKTAYSDARPHLMPNSNFDELLTVLRRAKAMLSKYRDPKAIIPSVLGRTVNRAEFKEIHDELDRLKSVFFIEDFEHALESMKSAMLTKDADEDLKELPGNLERLIGRDEPGSAARLSQRDLETVKLVVTEKTGTRDPGLLPSYLRIDPRIVEIEAPVRLPEGKSKSEVIDGALVRYARYLGCKFALKVFESSDPEWNRKELLKEVCSLMELHHPHIVQIIGFAQNEERCMILMELMQDDLRHFMIKSGRRFAPSEALDIISQIAKGMYYLHEQQYVHGELKCSNILVQETAGHFDVKISDLRSCQKLGVWDPKLLSQRSRRRWTAPEVKEYGEPGGVVPTHELLKKADTYSFGMVCYEVLTGFLPFQDISGEALELRIKMGLLKQELPAELDENLRGLIEKCWESDPDARPTFEGICHQLEFIRTPSQSTASFLRDALRMVKNIPKGAFDCLWGGKEEEDACTGRDILPEFVRIPPADLKLGRLIGSGGNGKVYEATWLGSKYAVKKSKIARRRPFASAQAELKDELRFLIELRHPSIVRLMGVSVDPAQCSCSIVMELMDRDLHELIKSRKLEKRKLGLREVRPFDLRETVHIIQRIALGMLFLHFRGVVHSDLKAGNILVPLNSNPIDVKISDFGTSQFIEERPLDVMAGTAFWRAPEILASQPATPGSEQALKDKLKAADVYSFAMTCFEVVTGAVPFEDQLRVFDHATLRSLVVAGRRPELPSDLNADLKKLVEDCWNGEPAKRPTFVEICERLEKISEG